MRLRDFGCAPGRLASVASLCRVTLRSKTELSQWAEEFGWLPSDETFERLDVLVDLWLRYAPALNITGARDRAGILAHVRDGLETVLCARQASAMLGLPADGLWVDVGSGGGFPGLVVAACEAGPVLLVEPRAKRAALLDLGARAIESDSTDVLRARIGDSTWNKNIASGIYRPNGAPVAIASARAVLPPAEWLECCRNVLQPRDFVLIHASRAGSGLESSPLVVVEGNFGRIEAHSVGSEVSKSSR